MTGDPSFLTSKPSSLNVADLSINVLSSPINKSNTTNDVDSSLADDSDDSNEDKIDIGSTATDNDTESELSNLNMWSKQQYYIQSQLDIIHAYVVHHDWKNDININDEKQDHKSVTTKLTKRKITNRQRMYF